MSQNIKTETVTLYEVAAQEVHQRSGMVDDTDGRELTNLEATEQIEALLYEGKVFVSSNGALSPEAKQYNTEISKSSSLTPAQKAAQFMVSVRATRPIKD